jgi:hypothetical protein
MYMSQVHVTAGICAYRTSTFPLGPPDSTVAPKDMMLSTFLTSALFSENLMFR